MQQRFSSVPACAASILALLSLVAAPVRARDYLVDQQCSPSIHGSYSIKYGTPVGQEFVPSHGVLNVAEVHVINGTMSNSAPADLYAVVHADSILGAELGTSAPTTVGVPFDGPVTLVFPTPVALTPGARYVLEIRTLTVDGNPMLLMGGKEGACPGVSGIWEGRPFSDGSDFWHRTGADAELPARPSTWGAVKAHYR